MQRIVLLTLLFSFFCSNQICVGANKHGESDSVSIPIYFRFDDALVLFHYRSNAQSLKTIHQLVSLNSIDKIANITILGSSSIDGEASYNNILAKRRAVSFYGYLRWRYPALKQVPVSVNIAQNNQVLIETVLNHPQMPNYNQVLDISKNIGSNSSKIATIKLLSSDTDKYFQNIILPYCRSAVSCVIYFKTDTLMQTTPVSAQEVQDKIAPIVDTTYENVEHSTTISREENMAMKEQEGTIFVDQQSPPLQEITDNKFIKRPILALKTNLLFDIASALNIELEVPIGKQWSIAGEFIFPWWLWSDKQYCLQLLSGNLEGRYWFGNRNKMRNGAERQVMTGVFAGFYAGGGYYDLEWEKRGYQGEFFIAAGISAGYVHSIGHNLRMEYSVGVGYLQTNYRYYEARQSMDQKWHLYRQNDGQYSWFGPTRAKVSLVWLLNRKVTPEKKGR